MTSTHTGPVQIRSNKEGGVTVLCPAGHYVTRSTRKNWAGSLLEAKVGAHQHGQPWIVECDGALPPVTPEGDNS